MKPLRLTLAAATLLAAGCSEKKDPAAAGKPGGFPPAPVTLATVQQKNMPLDVRTFGTVEPIATVGIKAQVSGELIDVSFTEGEEVEKGKVLFTIQPRLFATQLAQAKANLERDQALALAAAQNLKRQEELDARGSGVKDELEKARAQAAATAATVKADEALVLIAETQFNYTTIESPIAGRTGAIRLRPGNLIRNTDDVPLTTVVQLDPIHVAFSLPEQNLDAIRAGMQNKEKPLAVTVRDPRDGRTLGEGKLVFIANTVDTTTGTVALKAEFTNKDRLLYPGAFVDVSLRLTTEPGVLVVPSSAITMSQQGPRVLIVKDDMTTESRAVTVTRTAGQESIIKDSPPPPPEAIPQREGAPPAPPYLSIGPGTKVVAGGQSRVLPGGKVAPIAPAGKPAAPPAPPPAGSGENPAAPPTPRDTPAGKPTASTHPGDGPAAPGTQGAIVHMGPIGPIKPALTELPTGPHRHSIGHPSTPHGAPIDITGGTHRHHMGHPSTPHEAPIDITGGPHRHSMGHPSTPHGAPIDIRGGTHRHHMGHPSTPHGAPLYITGGTHRHSMGHPSTPQGAPIDITCGPHGVPMGAPSAPHVAPMGAACFLPAADERRVSTDQEATA